MVHSSRSWRSGFMAPADNRQWDSRFTEVSTWSGLGMVMYALSQFFGGAGTLTPTILNEAGHAATQVGEALSAGMDPMTAVVTAAFGAFMAVTRTSKPRPADG